MEFKEVIQKRYSCKKYSGRQVEDAKLAAILQAGRLAPTAKNLQEQHVYVVQSPEVLARIDAVTPCRYGAPTVLVIAFDSRNVFVYPGEYDGSVSDDALWEFIDRERKELTGEFCRGCGYCMPCPAGIEISTCARMNMLLRRSPWQRFFTPEWREKMERIRECQGCGACRSKCPYELDPSGLLKNMLQDYREFYEAHRHLLSGGQNHCRI